MARNEIANAPVTLRYEDVTDRGECDKLKGNASRSETSFDYKRHFLIAPLLPDIAHRRICEQLCKASEFLKSGDLDNCRIAIAVGMEWADYLHHNRRRRA